MCIRDRLWRWQVGEFARRNGCADLDELTAKFPNWAYWQRQTIMDIEPPPTVVRVIRSEGEEDEWLTLWDVWNADRVAFSQAVAAASDISQADAYVGLYQAHLLANLARANDPETPKRAAQFSTRYAAMVGASNRLESKRLASLNDDGEEVEVTRVMWCGPDLSDTVATRISL